MTCQRCGNNNCEIISEINTTGKDFSAGKGICGAILLGPIGVICGLCGEGKKTNSTNYWVCNDCGNKFKV